VRKYRIRKAGGQRAHYPPCHDLRIIERRFPVFGQHGPKQFVQKGVGKGEADIGADAVAAGKFHGQPAFHPLALYDDDFRRQGGGKRAPDAFSHAVGKEFQPVSGITSKNGHYSFYPQGFCALHIARLSFIRVWFAPAAKIP